MIKKAVAQTFANTASFPYLSNLQMLKIQGMVSDFGNGPLAWVAE
jgi:hypothetical protein